MAMNGIWLWFLHNRRHLGLLLNRAPSFNSFTFTAVEFALAFSLARLSLSSSAPKIANPTKSKKAKRVACSVPILLPFPLRLPRAATKRAQLTVTTSSTKRRKVSPEPRSSLGEARRHDHSEPPSALPPDRRSSSASNPRSKSSSLSPPRYVPAHLQFPVPGTRPQSGGRSPTPATAYAGLSLSSDYSVMPSDHRDGTPPTNGSGRSPSPGVKRPASEIADSDPEGGVSTSIGGGNAHDSGNMTAPEDDSIYPTPSSSAPNSSQDLSNPATQSHDVPSIDDQLAQVTALVLQPLEDGQKGYVISMTWMKKVFARSSTQADRADKESLESELGPVDNSDIVLDTDPETSDFKDEANERYVPIRPGLQMSEDFELVPQAGWDLIMKWYGLADQSPVIVRYAHNTNPAGDMENVIYELHPPIFTFFKLSNPSAGMSPQILKEKNTPAPRTLASRQMSFQKWLTVAKQLAGIDLNTKVRVWKILGGLQSTNPSASATPAVSRAASPAPAAGLIPGHKTLVVDLNTFLALSEGSQRVLLEGIKDQTANVNYNGRMSLDVAGLAGTDTVVLEEQVGGPKGGEWVSEASAQTLKRLGIPAVHSKKELSTQFANKSPTPSGRSTPALENRGRRGRDMGLTGFENLGNTCYQNAATQCVRAVEELTYYFLSESHKKDLNPDNPLAYNGAIAKSYAGLLRDVYREPVPSNVSPGYFRRTIGKYNPAMSGFEQHDSQEFLMFLLDGLSEDLNRIKKKPYIEKPDSTDEMVHDREALEKFAAKSWDIYKARNDSVITDLFAGMYKSTLVCPECDKVSIIFDPFSSLTLPIPMDEPFAREIIYVGLGRKPLRITAEVDRTASLRIWKEAVAKKMDVDADRIIVSEVYQGTFFKHFDSENQPIQEMRLSAHDDIVFYEVEATPTSAAKGGILRGPPKFNSPEADCTLVPIFNRRRVGNKGQADYDVFGNPSFIVVTREEAQDFGAIFHKLLNIAASMTTRDILGESQNGVVQSAQSSEDSDTVLMNEDDVESADSTIKTSSVEDEDSIVDVSMHDASQSSPTPTQDREIDEQSPVHPLAGTIAPALLSLFDAKVMKTKESIPKGRSIDQSKDYPLLSSLIKPVSAPKEDSDGMSESTEEDKSDANSETDVSDVEPSTKGASGDSKPREWPLIRPGDAIVLDWNDDAYDALFCGNQRDDNELRGEGTWQNIEVFYDRELIRRRAQREDRKARGITLDECLDEFSKEEILSQSDAWHCPRCKEHRQARKKFELWKAPDIMVIHLKRFGAPVRGMRMKLDTLVKFPLENLDMTGRVQGPDDGNGLVYDLIGVDNHSGTMAGGHYTAYAKNFVEDKWCSFNDSNATVMTNPQQAVGSRAYLLFYRRRSNRPLGGPSLQKIVDDYKRGSEEGEQSAESRGQSPSGEGQCLGGSSRNGSSSALIGAGAAHQAGDGGLQTGPLATKEGEDDSPPQYGAHDDDDLAGSESGSGQTGRLEGMQFTGNDFELDDDRSDPLSINKDPSWSFKRVPEAHDLEQMTAHPPGSFSNGIADDDDLFDDNDSTVAVGDGDLDDLDARLLDLKDSPPPAGRPQGFKSGPGSEADASFEDIPPLIEDNSDDDLPVVELRVGDDDKMVSD
ncbi:uncharacterized protein PFLUO_LOCUS2286 [Penicillium psychrofluorescens]|uniref:uncharacterized protein n=1 Tax=Penicillium psychrofluorescens TaxID=3158075 RepID=UPI003CCC9654